jgi:hypothetical protein
MQVQTVEDALGVYFEWGGESANQPAHALDTEYDNELGGWVFENNYGPLALVRDDGTVVAPVEDADSGEWVIPG